MPINGLMTVVAVLGCWTVFAATLEREKLWPAPAIPDRQTHQIAAMKVDAKAPGFVRAAHTEPYLEWSEKPAQPNGICLITISGGGYTELCCNKLIARWIDEYTSYGCQCVNLVYRSPRPLGLPLYQSAWEDGQRAVRLVRAAAARRGYDPERIGVIGMSAGGHLAALLATRSQTKANAPVDDLDRSVPCHVNFAFVCALPFALSDGIDGRNVHGGNLRYATFDPLLTPDAKTPPVCFFHGANDIYSPMADTELYRLLRQHKIPTELHLYADRDHCGIYAENCFEEAAGFLRQLNLDGRLGTKEALDKRFTDAPAVQETAWTPIWPADRTPNAATNQCLAEIKWFIPRELKTKAIQIVYSGGGYGGNNPDSPWDGTRAARRFLNAKGMTVVALRYRTPRPFGMPKHLSAWQDVQRAVRLVRSAAAKHALDGNQIGLMGGSAGGHLTLMGATSSLTPTYNPIDDIDRLSCSVQWGIACYPAYVLTERPGTVPRDETALARMSESPAGRVTADLATRLRHRPRLRSLRFS